MLQIVSFSYRQKLFFQSFVGIDCRTLRNPHFVPELKPLVGQDKAVQDWLMEHDPDQVRKFLDRALDAIKSGKEGIAFGCTGGRHRSPAMACLLSADLTRTRVKHTVKHLALI